MDKSRKSNVVVYKHISEESFAGGALAIANHIAGLAKNVTLVTATGTDFASFKPFLDKKMKTNVELINFIEPASRTIVKRRFIHFNQKVFEVCYLNDNIIDPAIEKKISLKLNDIIDDYDLVLASDFGHGFFTEKIAKAICQKARFLAVNTQTNGANMGFNLITRYSDVDYAAMDELEIRYAAHDKNGELSSIMKKVANMIKCKNLIITRGNYGAVSLVKKDEILKAPALALNVIDPIGAGDAFLAFTAPLAATGAEQDLVVFIGNAVGALAVQIICNRDPVDVIDLKKFITTLLK